MAPLVQPNVHIALVHFPLALLAVGVLIEFFSFLGWRRSSFRIAGRWMILLGALMSVLATTSGLYALAQQAGKPGLQGLLNNPATADLGDRLRDHLILMASATTAAMFLSILWIALSNLWRDRLQIPIALLLMGTLGVMMFGAHLGGEIVYHDQFATGPTPPATQPTSLPANQDAWYNQLAAACPPRQAHMVIAGLGLAMAALCCGLSIRQFTQPNLLTSVLAPEPTMGDVIGLRTDPLLEAQLLMERSLTVPRTTINHTPPVFAGRFWLLALLILLITAASGASILAHHLQSVDFQRLWDNITKPIGDSVPVTRRYAHVIAGVVILLNSFILMLAARLAPRSRVMFIVFVFPLLLAMIAQVWLGVLLTFDGAAGTIMGFGK